MGRDRFFCWIVALLVGCGQSKNPPGHGAETTTILDASDDVATPRLDSGRKPVSTPEAGVPQEAGRVDSGAPAACVTPPSPPSCAAPESTALPICKLSETGCMDAKRPTAFASTAVPYEVNSPLWSDGAAKTRAFVLPSGGKIHVDAGTGKWEFPVGSVLLKNFLFDGKLVETRLFMHVNAATAALIGNGTDWVGYNYAWNEAQTEATIVSNAGAPVSFATGKRTVTWTYPSFGDCIACHSAKVGPIGTETAQMNRVVGSGNQIDAFVTKGLFDGSPPATPYAAPLVEPYQNAALGLAGPPPSATLEDRARSYLSTNCSFCHRADVNDQGFDLRHELSFAQTSICDRPQQNGIPGMAQTQYADFKPGDHANSAIWIRMNTPVPPAVDGEIPYVGRMPPTASYVVDTQAVQLIADWIDATKACPAVDGGAAP